jgi:hypothetical protein
MSALPVISSALLGFEFQVQLTLEGIQGKALRVLG